MGRMIYRALARAALAVAALAVLSGPGATAGFTWMRAESPHFVVYGDGGERNLRAYAGMLEDFDTLLRIMYGLKTDEPAARKLDIYLLRDSGQLRRVWPGVREHIVGIYSAGDEDIFAVATEHTAAGWGDNTQGDDVILHEYVHHFMSQYYPAGYPSWMMEGFAEYYATADLGRSKISTGAANRGRAASLMGAPWLPIGAVLSTTASQIKEEWASAYYAEAWILTHYIMSDEQRRLKLIDYLKATRAGRDPVAAWQDTFGQDTKALEAALHAYTSAPLLGRAIPRTWPEAPVTVATLSPGTGAVILENQQTKTSAPSAKGEKLLPVLREAERKYPDDHFVKLARARAEIRFGDRAWADATLDRLIAADAKDVEALRLLGMSKLAAGRAEPANVKADYAAATKLFLQAAQIDQDNYQTLMHYAESRSTEPNYPTEALVDVWVKAVSLAPQLTSLRIEAAQAAMHRDHLDLARSLLTPVIGNPHASEDAKTATAIMASIDARAKLASTKP
jgi:tetratricopeptide (TPR) repeat protein